MNDEELVTQFLKLLKALIMVGEAAKGIPGGEDDRFLDAEGVLTKFLGHASSAFYLFRGTRLPEVGANFFDYPSINTLARSTIESFLVFHYVFLEPQSKDEKDLRYWSWVLGGLLERQKFPATMPETKQKLTKEGEMIIELQRKISNNTIFKSMKVNQQNETLKKGRWRFKSWTGIGTSAGLDKLHAREFYSYLCGYAHSGNISILQIRQTQTAQRQKGLSAVTIRVIMIAIAFMMKSYMMLFPETRNVIQDDLEISQIQDVWIAIGSGEY